MMSKYLIDMMTVDTGNSSNISAGFKYQEQEQSALLQKEGIYPICKPEGVSSFRMVQLVRKNLGIKKVGHTGTLDPFASGVLIICAGRSATKLVPLLMDGDKEYKATLQLGVTTTTQDPEGTVLERRPVPELTEKGIAECLTHFTGEQLQTPPRYSALKHKGKPLYYYARKGIKVEKKERLINIKELCCTAKDSDYLTLRIVCSRGTYIRTLAADIGEYFGCGAHLVKLQRTRNGIFSMEDSLQGDKLFASETAGSLLDSHHISVARVKELIAGSLENN